MQSTDHLLIRKGKANNVMVFPDSDYDTDGLQYSNGQYKYVHRAYGADMFRYSWNFAQNWSSWQSWEDESTIAADVFDNSDNWWKGQHIMVQCKVPHSSYVARRSCHTSQTGATWRRHLAS